MTIFIMIIIVIKFKKWTFYLVVFPSWYTENGIAADISMWLQWSFEVLFQFRPCHWQNSETEIVLVVLIPWNFIFWLLQHYFFFYFFCYTLNTHALCYNCTFDYNTKTEITTSLKMCMRVCIATEMLQCNFVQFC